MQIRPTSFKWKRWGNKSTLTSMRVTHYLIMAPVNITRRASAGYVSLVVGSVIPVMSVIMGRRLTMRWSMLIVWSVDSAVRNRLVSGGSREWLHLVIMIMFYFGKLIILVVGYFLPPIFQPQWSGAADPGSQNRRGRTRWQRGVHSQMRERNTRPQHLYMVDF